MFSSKKARQTFRINPHSYPCQSASINKGFALIEMLVVIVIIGILAGIILVVFGPVRERGKDTKIVSDMLQVQSLAENIYLDNGNYDNLDPVLSPEVAAIESDLIALGSSLNIPFPPASQYCAYAPLNSTNNCSDPGPMTENFCVDSWGTAKKVGVPNGDYCVSNFLCRAYVDFNDDGAITMDDSDIFANNHFGRSRGDPGYDPRLDVDDNGIIFVTDYQELFPSESMCTI